MQLLESQDESAAAKVAHDADAAKYEKKTPRSKKMFFDARKIMPGGQSHNARFFDPYPFYAAKARGKYIWDVDGNRYVDYWMGHTALILGHSPNVVVSELRKQIPNGLLFGSPNKFAFELATLVNKAVPCAESIRFCTTGAEATMYAVRLARAFTRKKTVIKMAGGWHGYNSSLTVGVSAPYDVPESAGLVGDDDKYVKLAQFNDLGQTQAAFASAGKDAACVIIEPVVGAGGVIPARKEYLEGLKKLCEESGALLIFDEIITGFRLALGGAQEYYGIKPDLCTLGKNLGGGLPVSAIAGRSDVLALADTEKRSKTERAWIGGGTFSENALCMRAGIATVEHLISNKKSVYSRINKLGDLARAEVDKVFRKAGIRAVSTGAGSLFATHFLSEGQGEIKSPSDVNSSNKSLGKQYYFSLIANDNIYYLPGHVGAVSTAHERSDIQDMIEGTRSFAERFA